MLRVADYFADSDTGRARRANEDAFFAHAPVFAVADGMGGAQAGEVASRTVVDRLRRGLPDGGTPEERLALLAGRPTTSSTRRQRTSSAPAWARR